MVDGWSLRHVATVAGRPRHARSESQLVYLVSLVPIWVVAAPRRALPLVFLVLSLDGCATTTHDNISKHLLFITDKRLFCFSCQVGSLANTFIFSYKALFRIHNHGPAKASLFH